MIFKAPSNLNHSDFMVLQSPSHTGCVLMAGPDCAGNAHTISTSDAGYRGLPDAKEMPRPSHFNPCPSTAPLPCGDGDKNTYPKEHFGLFIENGNCIDTFT